MEAEKISLYAMAVGFPVATSVLMHVGGMVHDDLSAGRTPIVGQTYSYFGFTFDDKFVIYELVFFAGLFQWLLSLMFYNLLKMFGWDKVIDGYYKALVDWVTTTGNEIKSAADSGSNPF